MTFVILCLVAYLVGAIPIGKILAKYRGIDIQKVGTGNIGASNTYLMLGKKAAFLVLLLDLGKAFLVMEYVLGLLSIGEALLVALFLLLGNTKSVFLRFTGGKGVATGLGVFLATEPIVALVMVTFWSLTLLFIKYLYVASLMGTFMVPILYYSFNHDILTMTCSFIICLMILLRHRDKFDGQEQVKPEVQKI
jgi:glycerol-3-phosphate acyltransferase PlsY